MKSDSIRSSSLDPIRLGREFARQSSLYQEVVAEREEIMRHKWFLSERAGRDVGFGIAAYDWIANHRTDWRRAWRKRHMAV